jgi:hypothetical protein
LGLVQLLSCTKFSCSSCGCTWFIGMFKYHQTFESVDRYIFASVTGEQDNC